MIEIRTLGRTSITVDGVELSGEAAWPKSLALVVYMAREPGPDRRDQILGMLWPDREEKRARHALNQLLYTLRKASPELDLESIEDALDFGREVWLDVEEFERRLEEGDLGGAVELYEGPFLADLSVDVPDFEHWADRQRTQLARAFRRAALQLAQDAKSAGRYEAAIAYCRRLLGADPLDDEVQHLYIECLYLAGERVAALRQFEKYSALLARELDVEPLDTMLELIERIRSESPEAAPGPAEVLEEEVLEAGPRERAPVVPGMEEPASTAEAAERPARPGAMGRRRGISAWVVGVLAMALVAVPLAAVLLWPDREGISVGIDGSGTAGPSAARNLAVLPFDMEVTAAGSETSGSAVAELLAANFDGLGPIEAVNHREIVAAWEQSGLARQTVRAPSELAGFGRAHGATAVLVGTVHEDGGELRLVADALSAEDGRRLARVDVRGPADSLFALTDRLTIQLAGGLWGRVGVPATRITGTGSVVALKHYLTGREHHGRGEWGQAVTHLRRASTADPTFLSARRLLSEAMLLAEMEPGAAYREFSRAQSITDHSELPPLERAYDAARLELLLGEGRSAIMALEALAERWPDDGDIGYQLADAYFHYAWRLGFELDAVGHRLEAVVAGDTSFAPALDHLWWIAMWRGDDQRAERWARAYRAAAPQGLWSDMAALVSGLESGSLAEAGLGSRDAGLAVLATSLALESDPRRPRAIATAFASDPMSMSREEIGVELLALLAFASGRPAAGTDWLDSARALGLADTESRAQETLVALYGLSVGGAGAYPAPPAPPPGAAEGRARRQWVRDTWLHGAVAARKGDAATAGAAARSLDGLPATGLSGRLGRSLAAALRGELALGRGDSATARQEFRAATANYTAFAPLSRWETLPYYRLRLGELEAERGEHEAAVAALRTLFDRSLGDVLLRPRAALAMARCLEELGEAEAATGYYAAAGRWWSESEPAFGVELEASRAGLSRVGGGSSE